MATPKFDRVAIQFMRKIKDEFVTSFTAGSGAMPAGSILTSADYISEYVNRAAIKLFNDVWTQSKGNKRVFAGVFPELIMERNFTLSTSTTYTYYTLADPNLDVLDIVEGVTNTGEYGVIGKNYWLQAIKVGNVPQYTGTADRPIFVFANNTIYATPKTVTQAIVSVIRQPIDPQTGDFLQQNGLWDLPYAVHWLERIAQIAFELYLTDSTIQS